MIVKYIKYDDLKKRSVGEFNYEHMPIFPSSEEKTVKLIVSNLRDIICKYGYVTIIDLYDIIEMCIPALRAERSYVDNKYGWMFINDIFMLYIDSGVTIGFQTKPTCLGLT